MERFESSTAAAAKCSRTRGSIAAGIARSVDECLSRFDADSIRARPPCRYPVSPSVTEIARMIQRPPGSPGGAVCARMRVRRRAIAAGNQPAVRFSSSTSELRVAGCVERRIRRVSFRAGAIRVSPMICLTSSNAFGCTENSRRPMPSSSLV